LYPVESAETGSHLINECQQVAFELIFTRAGKVVDATTKATDQATLSVLVVVPVIR